MAAGSDWSGEEIDRIVADYFAMLGDELAGRTFSKAGHNRALQDAVERSRGSIEFKHQNISAVMLGLGQPWITGYKPAANFQNALVNGVLRWLEAHPGWLAPKIGAAGQSTVADSAARLWIGPPPTQRNEPPPVDPAFMAAIGRKYDVAERDARNRALGRAGEDGDGYGYDIHSFAPDGRERLLEVKTTNGWERTPFHITRNELAVAEERRDEWHLVRLYDFARVPRGFELRPPLQAHTELTATSFLAALR